MKKIEADNLSEAEKVIKSLTGQVGVDKKTIISAIASFRQKNIASEESIKLGHKLFQILLENGLNESDVINPQRLLNKIDGFLYEGKIDTAIEILEVLDGIEYYQKFNEKGKKVYYVSNEIEAEILAEKLLNAKNGDLSYTTSARPIFNNYKASIFLDAGKFKEAKSAIDVVLDMNPVNFDANMLNALLIRDKNLKKFKQLLFTCWNYAYTKNQLISFYKNLSYYYEKTRDLTLSAAVLCAIKTYEDADFIENDLKRLQVEMNKTAISPYQIPDADQIIRLLKKENIAFAIPSNNFAILCYLYEKHFIDDDEPELLNILKNNILDFANESNIIEELEKRAKEMKKNGEI